MKRKITLTIGLLGATGLAVLVNRMLPDSEVRTPTSKDSTSAPISSRNSQRPADTGLSSAPVPWWQRKESRSELTKQRMKEAAAWADARSAGLVFDQATGPDSPYPVGTVRLGDLKFDLGETPPFYKHQLATSFHPILIGDNNNRHTFETTVMTLAKETGGYLLKCPLNVEYPSWGGDAKSGEPSGLETSGGLVFETDENPITRIGVLIPRVIPDSEGAEEEHRWQIHLRANSREFAFDTRTKAKLESLENRIVLMATDPEKIPSASPVIWFKFEKDGSVSLVDK